MTLHLHRLRDRALATLATACLRPRCYRFHDTCLRLTWQSPWLHYRATVYEQETLDWIDTWTHTASLFLDIGANVGIYSCYAATRYPDLQVIAVEPELSNAAACAQHILLNHLPQVHLLPLAVGATLHLSTLKRSSLLPGASLHRVRETPMWWQPFEPWVASWTIDALCERIGQFPAYLKIDVDGLEETVLHGAEQTLRHRHLRSLLIELEKTQRPACAALLTHWGWRCCERYPYRIAWDQHWLEGTNEIWEPLRHES